MRRDEVRSGLAGREQEYGGSQDCEPRVPILALHGLERQDTDRQPEQPGGNDLARTVRAEHDARYSHGDADR